MAGEHAQLCLRRTGGLAGVPLQARLDTRSLPDAEAQELIGALDRYESAPQMPQAPSLRPGAADTMHYELKSDRGGATRTVSFSERQTPEALTPVIRALMERAAPAPRTG